MEDVSAGAHAVVPVEFYVEKSQRESARRHGINQMHVSRLQRAALEQLRKYVPQESAD